MTTPSLPVLEDTESSLRSLVQDAQHFAIYRVRLDPSAPYGARVTLVSPSLRDLIGMEDPYDFAQWFHNIHPDDLERVQIANQRSLELGEPYDQVARCWNAAENRWMWLHTISNPRFDPAGRIAYFDGMVVDVTDHVNLRETERLRKAAEGLREIIQVINTNRPLAEILDFIVTQARHILQASATMIRHLDEGRDVVVTVASSNLPEDYHAIGEMPFYRTRYDEVLMGRQVSTFPDIQSEFQPLLEAPLPHNYSDLQRRMMEADVRHFRCMLKAPIFLKDQMFGGMTFYYDHPRSFSEEDCRLAMSVADQAALAIENARLIDQVKQNAVIEERGRLARELHDAVTQTLFSTTLIAEVLPVLWERNPEEGRRRLDELRQLTRGALAEMRTLLLELRPAALADTDLGDLLRHLANAFIGRARVPVDLHVEGRCSLPLEVKAAFYRIAQESLNNVARHAEAEHVRVSLTCTPDHTGLVIDDDGQGFEPDHLPPDHLGLGIMRERAAQAGAVIHIRSQPGAGTTITVTWTSPTGEMEGEK